MPPEETPPGGETPENSTIRQLRQSQDAERIRAEAEKKRADDLAEQLKTIERGKLADTERLTLELADRDKKLTELGQRAAKVDQYEAAFQTLYAQELAAVPDAARTSVERLSKSGDWNQRLEALRDARGLLAPPQPVPPAGGTITQPGGGAPAAPPAGDPPAKAPLTPEQLRRSSFGPIIQDRGVRTAPGRTTEPAK